MSAEALTRDLGTVAHSGTRELSEKIKQSQQAGEQAGEKAGQQKPDLNLIGQFGVGFYSGYLAADRIEVVSRAAGEESASRWVSEGKDNFTVEPAERDEIGTSIVLHLKEGQTEYADEWRLRDLVRRYSDFIQYPIEL